jgi:hypothetical protein
MVTRKNTISNKIEQLFNSGLNINDIKTNLDNQNIIKSKHYIRNVVYRIRVNSGLISTTTEQATEQATKKISITTEQEQTLIIEIKEQDNNTISLYVKTNKVFEDYLKATKELRQTHNLWGYGLNQEFYYMRLDNTLSDYDDLNNPIFYRNSLNQAILRLKGISEGLHFEINLNQIGITEDKLKTAIKSLSKLYSEFYYNEVINNPNRR